MALVELGSDVTLEIEIPATCGGGRKRLPDLFVVRVRGPRGRTIITAANLGQLEEITRAVALARASKAGA